MSGSFLPLHTPRVSVEATIYSDQPGITTLLVEFFSGAKLFAKIQRTNIGITTATIQGHPKHLSNTLDYLKGLLLIKYDTVMNWDEAVPVAQENRLKSITVLPGLERYQSSDEFQEKELEEISFGGSAATENVKKIVKEAVDKVYHTASNFAKGWIPAVKEKHISVRHKSLEFDLEVSTLSSFSSLIEEVERKFNLAQPIKLLYRLRDETPVLVTDVKDLQEGFLYYALTVIEDLPKKQTVEFSPKMEEFFQKLKTEEELDDQDIWTIKDCFGKQGIRFKQLMATGDLALTESELKDYGITQGGLRKAILSAIKNYAQ